MAEEETIGLSKVRVGKGIVCEDEMEMSMVEFNFTLVIKPTIHLTRVKGRGTRGHCLVIVG
jgi:hypothetical protein